MLIPILYMTLIFALSSIPGDALKINSLLSSAAHVPLFGTLAFLWMRALRNKEVGYNKVIIYSIIITICYAIFDEFHQSLVPGRDASLGDIAMDALGCIAAVYLYKRKIQ